MTPTMLSSFGMRTEMCYVIIIRGVWEGVRQWEMGGNGKISYTKKHRYSRWNFVAILCIS